MRVKFLHVRRPNVLQTAMGSLEVSGISPNGGKTIAYVVDEDHNVHGYAYARCHERDNYNKRQGRVKAEGRLRSPRYYTELSPAISEEQFIEMAMANNGA